MSAASRPSTHTTHASGRLARVAASCVVAFWLMLAAVQGRADAPDLRITADRDLRFGTFAVPASGWREVTPSGQDTSSGIVAMPGATQPAQFTLTYDRGNNGRSQLNVQVVLIMLPAPVVTSQGMVAQLTAYQTDLPGAARVAAGQPVTVNIPDCRQRLCTLSFRVGARLSVDRTSGGGRIEVPVPVTATVLSIR